MREIIKECLETLGECTDDITDETDMIDEFGLDSVAIINIISMLEERLGFEIPDITEFVTNLNSFGKLAIYLEKVTVNEKGSSGDGTICV